jgi:hypothetical protein
MMISTPKVMVSIFWSKLGFSMITVIPPRTKFSALHFCGDIIPRLVERMPFDQAKSARQLMLHMNNATPSESGESIPYLKKFRIRLINHPLYSPELRPSDFSLFEKLKGSLAGQEFESTEELLLAIREVADSIGRAELESVCDTWKQRLSGCIQMKGGYVA